MTRHRRVPLLSLAIACRETGLTRRFAVGERVWWHMWRGSTRSFVPAVCEDDDGEGRIRLVTTDTRGRFQSHSVTRRNVHPRELNDTDV